MKSRKLVIFTSVTLALAVAAFGAWVASAHRNAGPEAGRIFHVKAANPCTDAALRGSLDGIDYTLSVDRELNKVAPYVACIAPIGTDDVGKDFPATLSVGEFTGETGVMAITVPGRGRVFYDVESAREP